MQCISLDCLQGLITEGAFMAPMSEGTPELSGTTVILLIFQADDQHEKITDVYVGLVVQCVESRLYAPDQISDFVSDIEVDLKVVHDALKVEGDLGKRHTFCLLINNYEGAMSIPMDPPYCLIYPSHELHEGCGARPLQHPQQLGHNMPALLHMPCHTAAHE